MNFKNNLRESLKEGVLLLAKYGLLIAAIIYAFSFSLQTRDMAVNGFNAAIAIKSFQQHGWLPQINQDGSVPDKPKVEEKK